MDSHGKSFSWNNIDGRECGGEGKCRGVISHERQSSRGGIDGRARAKEPGEPRGGGNRPSRPVLMAGEWAGRAQRPATPDGAAHGIGIYESIYKMIYKMIHEQGR